MARLQLLNLPSDPDGDRIDSRFGFVVDQASDLCEDDRIALRAFASQAGAQGVLVVSGVLDVDHGDDEQDEAATEAVAGLLAEMTVPAVTQPVAQQPPKLPPANTTEGKLARVWRSRPTYEGDPQA